MVFPLTERLRENDLIIKSLSVSRYLKARKHIVLITRPCQIEVSVQSNENNIVYKPAPKTVW